MTRRIHILAAAGLMLAAAGCRKERTCECKYTRTTVTSGYSAGTVTNTWSSKVTKARQKKKEFKEASDCYSTTTSRTETGGALPAFTYTDVITEETSCTLK